MPVKLFDSEETVRLFTLYQQIVSLEAGEWKLKASRDRGLKPLLRFLAKLLNRNIIDKIDDHFTLEFVGLDDLSETEKHEMLVEQISSYMTLNEARRTLDLPDLPGGDIPMNPTFVQAMSAQQDGGGDDGGGGGEDEPPGPGGAAEEDDSPQYTEHFGFGAPPQKAEA